MRLIMRCTVTLSYLRHTTSSIFTSRLLYQPVRLVVDGVGYVEPLLTKYEKLHALHSPADCHVGSHGVDDKEHVTEKRGVDIVKQEIRRGDNEHIAIQHHAAKRHIAVFIHHCGYHIGATTVAPQMAL